MSAASLSRGSCWRALPCWVAVAAAAGQSDQLEDASPSRPRILAPAVEGKVEFQSGWAHYVAPEFPFALRPTALQGGYAIVAYTFDDAGIITDRIVLAASHPAFGEAVLAVMPQWRLNAAEFGARERRDTRTFEFERRGVIMSGTQRDAARTAFDRSGDAFAAGLSTHPEEDLDAPLIMIAGRFPGYPDELRGHVDAGEAVIEFVVDSDGWVRVPAVVYASNPAFGSAVMSEIHAWRFSTPLREKKPTQATVTRTVQFERRRP